MKKIGLIIVAIVVVILVGLAVWKMQNFKSQPAKQTVPTEENSLSISAIHQNDNFYNIQVEYPQFTNVNSVFNKKISDLITGEIETFKKDAKDNYEARRATASPENPLPENPDQPFDFIGSWEPDQINDNYISFVIHLYYFVGGAHGANEIHAFNYDLKKGKEINILDFLNSSQPALEKLAELSNQNVTSQLKGSGVTVDEFLQQMINGGTEPTLENYQNFNFNYNSLTIYFQQYQVAPGAAGEVTIIFYKDTLNSDSIMSGYLQ